MDKKALKDKLKIEGFKHIYEWHDEPGVEYPAHAHKDKVSMYILNGSITFWFEDKTVELKEGERFDVPVGKQHTAKVSLNGCDFLVGEMIEGDS